MKSIITFALHRIYALLILFVLLEAYPALASLYISELELGKAWQTNVECAESSQKIHYSEDISTSCSKDNNHYEQMGVYYGKHQS